MRRYIDIGANLTDPQFLGIYRGTTKHAKDLDAVIARAVECGVRRMLVTGASLSESEHALEIARTHPSLLYSTVGVHPCSSAEVPDDHVQKSQYYQKLRQLALRGASDGRVRAFGEIGLDYDRLHYAPAEKQREVFAEQLEIAKEVGLPLFLHSRAAAPDFLKQITPYAHLGGVVHSFTGTLTEMQELLELGFSIGINGCSLKTEENLKVVKELPLNKLMLETDAPWCEVRRTHAGAAYLDSLTPNYEFTKKPEKWQPGQMVRGRNEPCCISFIARVVAGVKGIPEEEVISAAYDNTLKVFFPETKE